MTRHIGHCQTFSPLTSVQSTVLRTWCHILDTRDRQATKVPWSWKALRVRMEDSKTEHLWARASIESRVTMHWVWILTRRCWSAMMRRRVESWRVSFKNREKRVRKTSNFGCMASLKYARPRIDSRYEPLYDSEPKYDVGQIMFVWPHWNAQD